MPDSNSNPPNTLANHGGILFPLDMFRPTILASIVSQVMVGKVRNVLDARLVLTRHPQTQLVLLRLEGSVIDGDAGLFWRENSDLATHLSQGLRSQSFLYYVTETPEKRQGFVVAQGGQTVAGDDARAEDLPADTPDNEWPVARLCGQIGVTLEELANGFAGGPTISLSVMEPEGDDRELLTTLIGTDLVDAAEQPQPDHTQPDHTPPNVHDSMPPAESQVAPPLAAAPQAAPTQKKATAEEDKKRRAAEHEAEDAERQARAEVVQSSLNMVIDELGVIVAPETELDDTDILEPFVVAHVEGDTPDGIPSDLASKLQGKRIDIAVPVSFLSEVFYEGAPLSRPVFESQANAVTFQGQALRVLAVLAPRLGRGLLIRRDRAGVYVSREDLKTVPQELVLSLLDRS